MRHRLGPAWLDAEYNAPAAVPDHAAIVERWAAASALARSGSRSGRFDIPYGSGGRVVLDVFPAALPSAPVLFYVHGGDWRARDKSQFSFIAPSFNAAAAMVVIPSYTLCPAVTVEQIVLQMVAALAWTWRNAARFGGDPSRIVVAGGSGAPEPGLLPAPERTARRRGRRRREQRVPAPEQAHP